MDRFGSGGEDQLLDGEAHDAELLVVLTELSGDVVLQFLELVREFCVSGQRAAGTTNARATWTLISVAAGERSTFAAMTAPCSVKAQGSEKRRPPGR